MAYQILQINCEKCGRTGYTEDRGDHTWCGWCTHKVTVKKKQTRNKKVEQVKTEGTDE